MGGWWSAVRAEGSVGRQLTTWLQGAGAAVVGFDFGSGWSSALVSWRQGIRVLAGGRRHEVPRPWVGVGWVGDGEGPGERGRENEREGSGQVTKSTRKRRNGTRTDGVGQRAGGIWGRPRGKRKGKRRRSRPGSVPYTVYALGALPVPVPVPGCLVDMCRCSSTSK